MYLPPLFSFFYILSPLSTPPIPRIHLFSSDGRREEGVLTSIPSASSYIKLHQATSSKRIEIHQLEEGWNSEKEENDSKNRATRRRTTVTIVKDVGWGGGRARWRWWTSSPDSRKNVNDRNVLLRKRILLSKFDNEMTTETIRRPLRTVEPTTLQRQRLRRKERKVAS